MNDLSNVVDGNAKGFKVNAEISLSDIARVRSTHFIMNARATLRANEQKIRDISNKNRDLGTRIQSLSEAAAREAVAPLVDKYTPWVNETRNTLEIACNLEPCTLSFIPEIQLNEDGTRTVKSVEGTVEVRITGDIISRWTSPVKTFKLDSLVVELHQQVADNEVEIDKITRENVDINSTLADSDLITSVCESEIIMSVAKGGDETSLKGVLDDIQATPMPFLLPGAGQPD